MEGLSEKKKILMLIPALGKGGAEKSFSRLSMSLAERGHQVTVVSFDDYIQPAYQLGGEWLTLHSYQRKRLIGKVFRMLDRLKKLKQLKSKINPHISISYLEGANYLNALSAENDLCIISCRGSITYDETIKGLWGFLRKNILIPWIYPKADKVVVVGEGLKQELIRQYSFKRPDDIHVIPSFIDKSRMDKMLQEPLDQQEEELFQNKIFVTHGRLAPEKGFHHLINVFKRYRAQGGMAKLIIMGEGPMMGSLSDLVEKLSLSLYKPDQCRALTDQCDVYLLGYQNNPYKYLHRSHLFVMTSSSEGAPNSIMEALALSVPVLSSDCPYGPREILNPTADPLKAIVGPTKTDYGYLLPSFSSYESIEKAYDIWTNEILSLEQSEELLVQLKQRGVERARDFEKDSVFNKWLTLIENN